MAVLSRDSTTSSTSLDAAPEAPAVPDGPAAPAPASRRGAGRAPALASLVGGLVVATASTLWLTSASEPPLVELAPVVVDASVAPAAAEPAEFCAAYGLLDGLDPTEPAVARVNQLRGRAEQLARVGTPADIPTQARRGFEIYTESSGVVTSSQVRRVTTAAGGAGLRQALQMSAQDTEAVSSFAKYVTATCFTLAQPTSPRA